MNANFEKYFEFITKPVKHVFSQLTILEILYVSVEFLRRVLTQPLELLLIFSYKTKYKSPHKSFYSDMFP